MAGESANLIDFERNLMMNIIRISICVGLLLSIAGVANADSFYKPNYNSANLMGWDGVNGGDVVVPYTLSSGSAVPGLGTTFNITYNFSPFTGIQGSGYEMELTTGSFGNSLDIRPDDIFGLPTAPAVGSQWGTTISVQAPPAAPAGWSLVSEQTTLGWWGILGAQNSETLADVTPGSTVQLLLNHGNSLELSWEVSAGGFAGSDRFDSNGRFFNDDGDATGGIHIAFAVPEPSSVLLFGIAGVVFGLRRRTSR